MGAGRLTISMAPAVPAVVLLSAGAAAASNWTLSALSGGTAEAAAQGPPAPPAGVSATCTSSTATTVAIGWTGVPHASSYTVYDSTTGLSGSYAAIAGPVTGTSYTTSTLAAGTYWFAVAAYIGSWGSGQSAGSGPRVIAAAACA